MCDGILRLIMCREYVNVAERELCDNTGAEYVSICLLFAVSWSSHKHKHKHKQKHNKHNIL